MLVDSKESTTHHPCYNLAPVPSHPHRLGGLDLEDAEFSASTSVMKGPDANASKQQDYRIMTLAQAGLTFVGNLLEEGRRATAEDSGP